MMSIKDIDYTAIKQDQSEWDLHVEIGRSRWDAFVHDCHDVYVFGEIVQAFIVGGVIVYDDGNTNNYYMINDWMTCDIINEDSGITDITDNNYGAVCTRDEVRELIDMICGGDARYSDVTDVLQYVRDMVWPYDGDYFKMSSNGEYRGWVIDYGDMVIDIDGDNAYIIHHHSYDKYYPRYELGSSYSDELYRYGEDLFDAMMRRVS